MSQISIDAIKKTKQKMDLEQGEVTFFNLNVLEELGLINLDKLPFSIRVLLENVLRSYDSKIITDYIGLLPNKKINIEKKDNYLLVECDNYKTKMVGQPTEDFPLIPNVNYS